MSETPDIPTTPHTVATEPAIVAAKPYWLYRFAAWVGIVAGIVFIVLSVFFAGFKVAHLGHHDAITTGGTTTRWARVVRTTKARAPASTRGSAVRDRRTCRNPSLLHSLLHRLRRPRSPEFPMSPASPSGAPDSLFPGCARGNGALADTADLRHYAGMSETPEPSTPPPPAAPAPVIAPAAPHSERLYQVAAWVAIVAGVTLIAVVILKFVWVLGY